MAPGIFRRGAYFNDEGAKIQYSGYYKCKNLRKSFAPPNGGLAYSDKELYPPCHKCKGAYFTRTLKAHYSRGLQLTAESHPFVTHLLYILAGKSLHFAKNFLQVSQYCTR